MQFGRELMKPIIFIILAPTFVPHIKFHFVRLNTDIVFVDGKIAADRVAILIIKVKRINPYIKIMALAENETNKTRVLDYGADEFATKPISAETIVDKVSSLLLTTEQR